MPGEILSAFMHQHYLAQPAPREILVSGTVADAPLLAAVIGERAGHPVEIRQRVRGNRRRWIEMALANARQAATSRAAATATLVEQLEELTEALALPAPPERIECFDISHTQGGETVASCVVFNASGPVKSDYRRFNIRDVAAGRRLRRAGRGRSGAAYARARRGETPIPDLLLIDGGRGQLARVACRPAGSRLRRAAGGGGCQRGGATGRGASACTAATAAGRSTCSPIPRPCTWCNRSGTRPIASPSRAIASAAARQRSGSVLESIPGLGPRRRRALLQQFGGLQGITRAGVDDLARTDGISRALAERIYDHFHEQPPER